MLGEIRKLCDETFREYVRTSPDVPPDLRRALKSHERVPRFLDNLVREFSRVHNVKREDIITATRDMTQLFVSLMVRKAKEARMSDLAKLTLKKEADRKKAINEAADEIESLGTTDVIEGKKGQTLRQTIDLNDKATRDKLGEIGEIIN